MGTSPETRLEQPGIKVPETPAPVGACGGLHFLPAGYKIFA